VVKEAFKLTEMPLGAGVASAAVNVWKDGPPPRGSGRRSGRAPMIALFVVFATMSSNDTYW